ncbi:BICRL-like protein [Mya arenaria]|uniref:BICRL-like protein n=1 Tax=Mya arenaria TaxID=6604 RepID=A0ABY7DXU8_MYAAR|nr:BICRL-like protein [Mya arenaria]
MASSIPPKEEYSSHYQQNGLTGEENYDNICKSDNATDLFGTQNDGNGSVFNWADEFLNDDHEMGASSVATELGNLSRNVNPSTLLTSAPPGALIVKTASGQQIQVNRQTQLQLQAQLLQQQQQQQQQMSTGFNQPTMLGRSVTPNSASGSMGLTFAANNVSQTISQLKSASPAPNMNILQLPAQVHNQQQQQPQQHQQFQIAPGTILQIPSSQTLGGASQSISGLVQGGALIGTPQQQTNLVNNQNSVIQNPNIVNVNFNQPQMLLNSQTQQRSNLNITNIQTPTHSPFNIQGGLQQFVVNHQGQQLVLQRANTGVSVSQPQNIVVRTAAGQSSIVQIQPNTQQIQKVQASATMTPEQKQQRLQQFQMLQKKILLKGRIQLGQQASLSQMVANLTKPSSSKGHVATILPLQQSALPVSLAPQAMSTAVVTVTSAAEGTGQTALQTSTTATSGGTQVAVPTQIKIADKMLTLSLTPAQREKVQSYLDMMTPEQQQQYLQTQQHVLQRIQRQQELNAQIRAQVEAQKKLAAANSQSPIPSTVNVGSSGSRLGTSFSQVETMTSAPQIPTPVATSMIPDLKTIPIPSTLVSVKSSPSASGAILNRGTKRSYLDIPKGTLINQQIRQDQNHAVAPDVKRPFHSWDDACRRLLRYHVFQSYGPSPKEFERFDEAMEDISVDLLTKKDTMMEKFRMLLLQETIRTKPSSELVMLQRMQNQELRKLLEEEKKQSIIDPDSFTPMPMRYLVKTERSESHTDAEASHSGSPPSFTVKQGPVNEESLNMDSSHDNSSFEEQGEGDIKVRKLVIKSDGMNFSSAFKRQSLDQSEISFDHIGDNSEMDDSCFSPAKRRRTTIDSNSAYESASALEEEDENTNDYSGLEDETRQAAIMISSADESEDTQQEYSENPFSVSRQSSIGNSHLNDDL